MNRLTTIFVALLAVSCVSQTEIMREGGETKSYVYHYGQVGGKGTAQSSMGTSVAYDGEKSLADVLQAIVARGASLDFTKAELGRQGVEMHREGQITARQLAKFQKDIALAEGNNGLKIAIATLAKK